MSTAHFIQQFVVKRNWHQHGFKRYTNVLKFSKSVAQFFTKPVENNPLIDLLISRKPYRVRGPPSGIAAHCQSMYTE